MYVINDWSIYKKVSLDIVVSMVTRLLKINYKNKLKNKNEIGVSNE